ncbi:anthranilate phosphoribosyltransferase [Formicincola oecophyllae]|uniref:Anthranilate phosphoribosyltransferase n=1 Tax=Formicincola oecophyllae TaxID=2558361 RepID=A0A4Y6UDF4_9PROT|nr:anthranilate phosphoribosyltransferase [Formicincola oecophyllae]
MGESSPESSPKPALGPNPLQALMAGKLPGQEATCRFFEGFIAGDVSDVAMGAFLAALAALGEGQPQLAGAAQAMRAAMVNVPLPEALRQNALDVCGTGGDGLGTLNVSTATAFVLAALGVPVAKHGGRAQSSRSGSTDVLGALGVVEDPTPHAMAQRLASQGLLFMAAPRHHGAMKRAAGLRRALGVRTLLNLVGPLCNPARVGRQMLGVCDQRWLQPMAETLLAQGACSVGVLCGQTDEGPLDEATLAGPTTLVLAQRGPDGVPTTTTCTIRPEMAGLAPAPVAAVRGGDTQHNAMALQAFLKGLKGSYRDTVLLNAALGLHVAGRGNILASGHVVPEALKRNVALAAQAVDSGKAYGALKAARAIGPAGTV